MTYYNYVSFYLSIFIYLFLKVESFTPTAHLSHSSVLVKNKLYFFGGITELERFCSNDVFYLDVSQPFNIQAPPWNDLTPNAGMPFKSCYGTVSLSNINNEQTIYLFGGITYDLVTNEDNFRSLIYSFNLNSLLTWDMPAVKGKIPERRKQINSVIDNTGNMYIFGGCADKFIGSPTTKFFNEMVIFNAVELSWSISDTPVIARASYTATLLSNGVIVYIGGHNNSPKIIDMSQITLYNTKSSTWTNKVCTKNKY